MKFSTSLEDQLSKVLLASVGYGILVALFFLYAHAIDLRSRADRYFTEKLVELISESRAQDSRKEELSSQIANVFRDWTESQNIPTRLEVRGSSGENFQFLPAVRLSPFALKLKKSAKIGSHEVIFYSLEMDYWRPLVFAVVVVLAYLSLVLRGHARMRKKIKNVVLGLTKPLEDRIEILHSLALGLPNSIRRKVSYPPAATDELLALDAAFAQFAEQILQFEARLAEQSFNLGRVKMAELLAHDIKSSIGLLNLRIQNLNGINLVEKNLIIETVDSVFATAINLLDMRRIEAASKAKPGPKKESFKLFKILDRVVSQKLEAIGLEKIIKFSIQSLDSESLCVVGSPQEFAAGLGNLLENSIEAINGVGTIEIIVEQKSEGVEICIVDSGVGISEKILPLLMKEGATFGKKNGSGLGLFRMRSVVEVMGGSMNIYSELGQGAKVILHIPNSAIGVGQELQANLEARSLSVPPSISPLKQQNMKKSPFQFLRGQKLIFVSEDLSLLNRVAKAWAETEQREEGDLLHFSDLGELKKWLLIQGAGPVGGRVYLFELSHPRAEKNIKEFVEEMDLRFESIILKIFDGEFENKEVLSKDFKNVISEEEFLGWLSQASIQFNLAQI